jgi:hypothetical protein
MRTQRAAPGRRNWLSTTRHGPALSRMTAADFVAAGGPRSCEPLKANCKLYVEYSNETWNGIFQQSHYCCDEGIALGLDARTNTFVHVAPLTR